VQQKKMKSSLIVAVLLGLVVVMASAHGGHHGKGAHGHHDGAAKESSHKLTCSYKNTKGHLFDLSRLSSYVIEAML
jgi:ABC-type cobalt transport system substrate-binding protein